MLRNLDWMHDLDVHYDLYTFGTDPFGPQSDGVGTIFPFYIENRDGSGRYLELPYTLPQDFTLFVLLTRPNINIWKSKLNLLVENGGMVHLKIHPYYMNFKKTCKRIDEYSSYFVRIF